MHLNELTIGVVRTLLVEGRLRRAGADDRIRRFAEDRANAAGANDERIRRENTHFHGAQIHGADTAANAVAIEHRREELPGLVLFDLALGFMPPHLFIERVKQLLSGGGSGKGGAVVERSAKAAKVQHSLRSAVEGDAHAVEQIDDARRGLAHAFDRRLIG
jgi:hypothetical protein